MVRRSLLLGLGIAGLACASKDPPAPAPPTPARDAAPAATADAAPTDPQVVAGTALWGRYCALCHGPKAMGYVADHAPSLVTTTFLATASDEFLRAGIGRGRPGTAMGGYAKAVGGPLDPKQIDQLIAFVRNGAPAPAALSPAMVEGNIQRGAVVYREKCQECHGTPDNRGESVHLFNPVFLATVSDAFVRHAVAFGRPGTKMLAFGGTLPESDIDAVVAHVRSQARAPTPAPLPKPPDPSKPPADVVINPKGKPPAFTLREDRFVPAEQVKKALDQKRKLVIVDARSPADWLRGHIPGAVSVPYYDAALVGSLPGDGTWIVAYCACPHHASGEVVDALRRRGVTTSVILDEGILVWQKMGFPVVDGDGKTVKPPPAKPPGGTKGAPPPGKGLPPTRGAVPAPKPAPGPARPAPGP